MSAHADLLLTKTVPPSERPGRGRDGDRVADHLQQQAVRRLEVVAWLTFAGQLLVWLAVNLVQGTRIRAGELPTRGTPRPRGNGRSMAGVASRTLARAAAIKLIRPTIKSRTPRSSPVPQATWRQRSPWAESLTLARTSTRWGVSRSGSSLVVSC